MSSLVFVLQQTFLFFIPLLIVALGAMFSERSGVLNIGLEGIMIMGAFGGIMAISIDNSESGSNNQWNCTESFCAGILYLYGACCTRGAASGI